MSCDYQRNRIFYESKPWYEREVPKHIRDRYEKAIKDFVENWIKDTLEEQGRRAISQYHAGKKKKKTPVRQPTYAGKDKKKKKQGGKKESKKPDTKKKVITDPFENVYDQTKRIVVAGNIRWKDEQRREMAGKMCRVMRWMRVNGRTPDANPIHGKHALPRVSSVAAYAALHDWLEAQGVGMTSSFDAIYESIWADPRLAADEVHALEHLLEQLEIEKKKRRNASPEQMEEILHRIHAVSPAIHRKVLRKSRPLQALMHA